MKKRLAKSIILAISIVAIMLLCTIAIVGASENKTYKITYYTNGNVSKTVTVKEGDSHTLLNKQLSSSQSGKTFFGWYDENGQFYDYTFISKVDRDYSLYEAYGKAAGNEADFLSAVKQAGTYLRLTQSITIDEVINLPSSGLVIIDLNGKNLTINTNDVAFKTTNASIHIMNSSKNASGQIIHTGVASSEDLMDASLFTLEPTGRRDVNVTIFDKAVIKSNVGLFDVVSDLTYSSYTCHFRVDGELEGKFLVRSYGIKNATFETSETTKLNVTGQFVFEDRGLYDGLNLTFKMNAGQLDILENTFITNELSKYNAYLTGGSFNRDFSNLYPNYVFESDNNGRYIITKCNHSDVIVGMTADCENAGEITYACSLCGVTHTEPSEAIGHANVKVLAQETVTTREETKAGYYSTICQRCGNEEREYFYPDPKDVYITVKYRLTTGEERTVRVKAENLFVFDSATGKLQAFSTPVFEAEYGVKKSQIFSVEIPLGIKTVAGGSGVDNTGHGVFLTNDHLEEIILPQSIENIETYAFADMSKLRTVVGLEHITGKIGSKAFQQTKGNMPVVQRMEINATEIGQDAFYNFAMTSLTFGKNVQTIHSGAFGLSSQFQTQMKEIFIEGNNDKNYNGVKLSIYNEDKKHFASIGSGHQFDNLYIVFNDHNFVVETTAPTCQAEGFDYKKCAYCGEEEYDNYKDKIDHNYVLLEEPVKSTCSMQGYEGSKCTMCDDVKVTKYYPFDPNNHDYTHSTKNSTQNICENDYHIIGVCVCGKSDPDRKNWKFQKATGVHEWDKENYLEYVYPTCGVEGFKRYQCKNCGYEVSEIYAPTGKHTFVTDNKNTIPATCAHKGTMVWVCSDCGESKEREVDLNPENHEWEKDEKGNLIWTVKVAATTEKAGTQQNKCVGCGKYQTKGIPVTSEQTKKIDAIYIILIILGGLLVLGGIGLTLYFAVFKKSASSGYKYKFNTLNKK